MTQTRSQAARADASEAQPLLAEPEARQQQEQQVNGADAAQPSTSGRSLQEKMEVFHKGVAISMWQNSGDDDSNWTNFIKSNFPFAALPIGFNRFSGKYSVLQTCPDTWNRWAMLIRALPGTPGGSLLAGHHTDTSLQLMRQTGSARHTDLQCAHLHLAQSRNTRCGPRTRAAPVTPGTRRT